MRKVSRGAGAPPRSLEKKDKAGHTELDRARAHRATATSQNAAFDYTAYKHEEVKQRLHELFHGKCAYCETFYAASAPVDVEHFRPKGAVSEDKEHPGYWWLAAEWTNLLPSCIDCNRKRRQRAPHPSTSLVDLMDQAILLGLDANSSGKQDSFPLAAGGVRLTSESTDYDSERALLLDPTRDDPIEFLQFQGSSSISLVTPAEVDGMPSQRGAMSIQIFGLNRLGLVQDRTRLLRRLEFLGGLVVDLGTLIQHFEEPGAARHLQSVGIGSAIQTMKLMQDNMLSEIKRMTAADAPYSAMATAWVERFAERLLTAQPEEPLAS